VNLRLGLRGAFAALALAAAHPAPNPIVGTWKLNTAKSTFTPGPGWRSQTRTYRATCLGGSFHPSQPNECGVSVSWTGVGASGEAMHVAFISRLDGKDYPMAGSANYDTLNATPVDAFTVRSEEKRDGKVVGIAVRKVSADGKVLTITDEGTNRKGEKFSQVLVFERE